MTEALVTIRDRVQEAIERGFFSRAAELCQIALNRASSDPDQDAAALRTLRCWRDEAMQRILPITTPEFASPPEGFRQGAEALAGCEFEAAIHHLRRALTLQPDSPDTHTHLGMALIGAGHFAEGWREYEWRMRLPWAKPRVMRARAWAGEAIPGKVLLLWDEQGLGDAIQFIRFAKQAASASQARVVFHGRPRLCRLFRSCSGLDDVIPRTHGFPRPSAHASIVSLPALLGLDSATGQSSCPYLAAEPGLIQSWGERLAHLPRPRVGLAWQGSPGFCNDAQRSMALAELLPILERFQGRICLLSLQKGFARTQIAGLPAGVVLHDVGRELDEGADAFVDTAAAMSHLDLVITTDTSLAHLAGALGVHSWLLLGLGSEWRWGRDVASTPFYPRTHLFRRRPEESWANVMDRVSERLARILS